jgi:MSHA biogenesis protein MshO
MDRVSGYTIQLTQPGPAFPGTPVTGRLANFITACDIQYDAASSLPTYTGLLTIRLTLTRNNETVTLYQEVHVSNVP